MIEKPYQIKNPEVSQAFYGKLKRTAEYYLISEEKPFNLYIQILSPDIENAKKDFLVELYLNNTLITVLNGTEHNWTLFHEEFAGDTYWQGPEFEKKASSGNYLIKISNENNEGKYVLVVGRLESFPFKEIINAYMTIPKLKTDFFNKPAIYSLFNLMGLFLLVLLIIIAAIITLITLIIKRIKHKKKRR